MLRGAAVEWVCFAPAAAGEDEKDGEGRWLEMVFADAECGGSGRKACVAGSRGWKWFGDYVFTGWGAYRLS